MAHADRAAEFRVGEGLPPPARKLLAGMGLWEKTLADGHRISYGNLSAWGEAELRANHFVSQLDGHGLQLDRTRFDRMLRGTAAEVGVEVCAETRVHLEDDAAMAGGWREVWLGSGDRVRCRWLIDATGRSATLARKLGATRLRTDALVAVHARLAPGEPGADEEGSTLVEAVADGWWYTVLLPSMERLVVFLGDGDLLDRRTLLSAEGFLTRLRQTRHVAARAALHPAGATVPHGANAGSSRLDRMAGEGWLAVGDAALAFDPLSSKGISNALYTGQCAARSILATEAGDAQAGARFQQHLADIFAAYQTQLRAHYALERRWPGSPFWQRRRG